MVELRGTLSVKRDSLKRREASGAIILHSCTRSVGLPTGGLLSGDSPPPIILVLFLVPYTLLLLGALRLEEEGVPPSARLPLLPNPRVEFALVRGRLEEGTPVVLDMAALDLAGGLVDDVLKEVS